MSLLMLYRPFPRTGSPAPEPEPGPVGPSRRRRRNPTYDEWLGLVARPEDGRPETWAGYH